MLNGYNKFFPFVQAFSVALPALLGMFWGAPLIARELEYGNLSIGVDPGRDARALDGHQTRRGRWREHGGRGADELDVDVVVQPDRHIERQSFRLRRSSTPPTSRRSATRRSPSRSAWRPGVLWRRTVPAMATTLAVFVLVRVPFDHFVRPRLDDARSASHVAQALTEHRIRTNAVRIEFRRTATSSRPNALLVGNSVVDNHGGTVTSQWLKEPLPRPAANGQPPNPGKGGPQDVGARPAAFTDCIEQDHRVVPPGRVVSTGLSFLGVPVDTRWRSTSWWPLLLGAFSYWWVRRAESPRALASCCCARRG